MEVVWATPTHSGLAPSSQTTSHEKITDCMPKAPNQDPTPTTNHG